MSIKIRLQKLEKVIGLVDVFRVIYVADDADKPAARDQYHMETGYRGIVVVMDETDRAM